MDGFKPERLRAIRLAHGLGQEDLAARSGVAQNTISEAETGRRTPRPSTLRKFAAALDVEVGDFFEAADSPKEPEPFSLEWARTADDAEFYRLIVTAPEEDTARLDKLSGELHRFRSRPVRRILTERNRKAFRDTGPEPTRGEEERLKERFDALYAEVNRRRPPYAVISWRGVGPAEVRWFVPEDEREALRPEVEKTLDGEEYIEIEPGDPATAERPPEKSKVLTRSAA